MVTTCNHALYAIVDVFTQYYHQLAPTMLTEVYKLLCLCTQQQNEQLATSAISCLENLVVSNGEQFSDDMWKESVDQIVEIFNRSTIDLYNIFVSL